MTSLEDLKAEQQQLIRLIEARKDNAPEFSDDPRSVDRISIRLASVNEQIAELEGPVDHGGWEDH